jgi:Arc/MetJ-type ribon-helix-helix transcriptional regulator
MPRKGNRSLKLSASLEAELEALVGTYLGNTRSEVITFILKEWLFAKREQLDRLRRQVDADESGEKPGPGLSS